MNSMDYDALALGRIDLVLGLDALKARQAEAHFPFLSANLVDKRRQRVIFDPYVILRRQGKRIGVIGLSEPEASQIPIVSGKVVVLDPTETLRRYVSRLRGHVDFLIVLSHLGLETNQKLAQDVPGIDIIVGGNGQTILLDPKQMGKTLIIQAGYAGRWVGRLKFTYDARGQRAGFTQTVFTLGADFPDDQEMTALVNVWKDRNPAVLSPEGSHKAPTSCAGGQCPLPTVTGMPDPGQ